MLQCTSLLLAQADATLRDVPFGGNADIAARPRVEGIRKIQCWATGAGTALGLSSVILSITN